MLIAPTTDFTFCYLFFGGLTSVLWQPADKVILSSYTMHRGVYLDDADRRTLMNEWGNFLSKQYHDTTANDL
jgi:hypothetical protein